MGVATVPGTMVVTPFRGDAGVAAAAFSDDAADITIAAAVFIGTAAVAAAVGVDATGAAGLVAKAGADATAAGCGAEFFTFRCSAATSRLRAADIGLGGGGALALALVPVPDFAAAMARLVAGRNDMKSNSTPMINGAMALEPVLVLSI